MEISTEICWNSKSPKPQVKMYQKRMKHIEREPGTRKKQSPHSIFLLNAEPSHSKGNLPLATFSKESHASKPHSNKTNMSTLECDLHVPICVQPCLSVSPKTSGHICKTPSPCEKKPKCPSPCGSTTCPDKLKPCCKPKPCKQPPPTKDPPCKPKVCDTKPCKKPPCPKPACCGSNPRLRTVKGTRSRPNIPVSILTKNAKSNCCKCCVLLMEYFKEVYRLFAFKQDSKVAQVFSELLDVAGCICHDCYMFLKKFIEFLIVIK